MIASPLPWPVRLRHRLGLLLGGHKVRTLQRIHAGRLWSQRQCTRCAWAEEPVATLSTQSRRIAR
jgi:hypothetical protein